jgi:hypothetical protein
MPNGAEAESRRSQRAPRRRSQKALSSALAQSGFCAVRLLRRVAFASSGFCVILVLRRSGLAPFRLAPFRSCAL